MKKALIITASIFAFLVLLIVGAVNFYFTNERLQRMVKPHLEEAVGRPVDVGSMSVSIFSSLPDAALNVHNFSIPGTENDTLLSVGQVSIRVEILPLWYNQYNITRLDFDQPRFIYTVFEDSTTNLDFLTEAAADTAMASEPGQPTDTTLTSVQIPALTIRNARFGYVDRSADSEFIMDRLDADLSLDYAREIATRLDLNIGKMTARMGEDTYLRELPVQLSQESVLNMENETLTLKEGALSIRGLSLSLNGQLTDWSAEDGPHADLKFTSASENFDELLKLAPSSYHEELEKLDTRGALALDGSISGALGGSELPSYNVNISVTDGYLKNPDLVDPITDIQLQARADNQKIELQTLSANTGPNSLSATGIIKDPLNTGQSTIDLTADLQLDLSTVKNFYPIDPDTLSMQGQLTANARLKGKTANIQEAVQEANISLTEGHIDYPQMGPPLTALTLDAAVRGNRLDLKNFSANSEGNTLRASGTVTDYLSDAPAIDIKADGAYDLSQTHHYYDLAPYISELNGMVNLDVSANGSGFDPMEWAINGRLQLTDVNAKGDSLPQSLQNLNGEMTVDPSSANLKNVSFLLGESDFNMEGKLTHYRNFLLPEEDGDTPQFTGSYQSKKLNVDEFIDWDEEVPEGTEYPIELPNLNSTVDTKIDRLIVMGVVFEDVRGKAGTTPTEILATDATAKLLEGTIEGSMTWTAEDPLETHLDFKGSVNKVQADAFFRDFKLIGGENNLQKYISGAFSTEVSYQSTIDKHLYPVLSTTVSSGNFGMTKARLKGHPMQQKVAGLLNASELENMAMDEWKATYNIKDGVLEMKDLRLTSGNIGAEMEGTQNLENGEIDYQLKLYLPGSFKSKIASVITKQAADALTQDNGTIMVPLKLGGTLEQPKVNPDQEVIKPIVKDQLKDKAGDALKKLFDR